MVTLGSGLKEYRGFYARTGRLNTLLTEPSAGGTDVQNLTLTYDEVGNLKTRDDATIGIGETLVYDGLSRLIESEVDSQAAVNIGYGAAGRITSKTGCGTYSYGAGVAGPHAVTGTSSCGDQHDRERVRATGRIYKSSDAPRLVTYEIQDRDVGAEACYSGYAMYVEKLNNCAKFWWQLATPAPRSGAAPGPA